MFATENTFFSLLLDKILGSFSFFARSCLLVKCIIILLKILCIFYEFLEVYPLVETICINFFDLSFAKLLLKDNTLKLPQCPIIWLRESVKHTVLLSRLVCLIVL